MSSSPRRLSLFLDSTIFDLQGDGGISRYWYELVSNIARRHQECDLTIFADQNTQNKFGRRLIEVTKDNRNVRLLEYLPRQVGRFFGPRLADEFKGFLWHSSYYRVPGRLNIPQVCTVHDFIYERYFSGAYAWLHTRKKRRAILAARQIICPSEATKQQLLTFFPHIDESSCHVIYHGLSKTFELPADAPAFGMPAEPYVLFVGSRAEYKNFRLTVISVKAVPGLELFIVGGKKLSNSELNLLRVHLPNRHRILEAPTDEILRDLYRGATALAYLSRCEGFGFPPLEAMSCGCPVIAKGASSIPEVVGDAAILLTSEDPGIVAQAIRAVQVSERRLSLREKGIAQARKFSWDRAVDATVSVYERAMP